MFDHHFFCTFSINLGKPLVDFVILIWGFYHPLSWFNAWFNPSRFSPSYFEIIEFSYLVNEGLSGTMVTRSMIVLFWFRHQISLVARSYSLVEHNLHALGTIVFPLFPWHLCTNCIYFLLQIMPKKHIASKRPRIEVPTHDVDYVPTFHTQSHQECYARFSHCCFAE